MIDLDDEQADKQTIKLHAIFLSLLNFDDGQKEGEEENDVMKFN